MTISAAIKTSRGAETTKLAFAVISTWPDTKNAEFEVIERIVAAAANINADVFVIDDDGYILTSSNSLSPASGRRISADDCEFAISLHFQSARSVDLYTYITLWNPPEFYHVFGYIPSTERLASHSDVLSCHSDVADAHGENIFSGFNRHLKKPFQPLFHSLPEPFLEPNITAESRLFYIGINWERISGTKGRHHYLLEKLDEDDLINIYGPEEFYGVKPWEGFKNYAGEIPFDGRSVLLELNKAGVCLAFSSAAHQRSGIMSTRLFEGLAAGAVVIANPHPFIDKYFSDCVYVVDDSLEPQEIHARVLAILQAVRANPAEAVQKARTGQVRLQERFSLEFCLNSLFNNHPDRVSNAVTNSAASASVSVLVVYAGEDFVVFEAMLANATRQIAVELHLQIVVSQQFESRFRDEIDRLCSNSVASGHLAAFTIAYLPGDRAQPRGRVLGNALQTVTTDFACVMECGETWFRDHLSSLAAALQRLPDAFIAASGKIREDIVHEDRIRRRFETIGFGHEPQLIEAAYGSDAGRFLFRSKLITFLPPTLMQLLDGCEVRALQLWAMLSGPLALSNAATFVQDQDSSVDSMTLTLPERQQIEFIRDSVRGNETWLRRRIDLSQTGHAMGFQLQRINLNELYRTEQNGNGLKFLALGFSIPEQRFVWIDGLTGVITFEMTANAQPRELVLTLGGRSAFDSTDGQICSISVNGRPAVATLVVGEAALDVRVPIAPMVGPDAMKMTIAIRTNRAEQVRNAEGKVLDSRYLGIRLQSFTLLEHPTPTIDVGTIYEFRKKGNGVDLLRSGFSQPEPNFVWIDGKTAQLAFVVNDLSDNCALALTVGTRKSNAGVDQQCNFKLNGSEVATQSGLSENPIEILIPLGATSETAGRFRLDIQLGHADPVVSASGTVEDARHLGLYLISACIVPNDSKRQRNNQVARLARKLSGHDSIGLSGAVIRLAKAGLRPVVRHLRALR